MSGNIETKKHLAWLVKIATSDVQMYAGHISESG